MLYEDSDAFDERQCRDYGIKMTRNRMKGQNRDFDRMPVEDLPIRAKTGERDYDWGCRHRGVPFDGLPGMIRKGVGRPWNKTHAEIVAHVKANYNSGIWRELISRVDWMIELHPIDLGGGVFVHDNGRPFSTWRGTVEYLVHPETGILMVADKEWAKIAYSMEREQYHRWSQDKVVYSQNRCFRKMKGHWYEIELVRVPNPPANLPYNINSDYEWTTGRGDNDWLYKLNLYDVVTKRRLRSTWRHELPTIHGYRTTQNKLVSAEEYNKAVAKYYRSNWYGSSYDLSCVDGKPVYAKSMRMIRNSEIRLHLLEESKLTAPNIVQKHN